MSEVTLEKLAARVDAMRRLLIMQALNNPQDARNLMCNVLESDAKANTADNAFALELERLAEDLRRFGGQKDDAPTAGA